MFSVLHIHIPSIPQKCGGLSMSSLSCSLVGKIEDIACVAFDGHSAPQHRTTLLATQQLKCVHECACAHVYFCSITADIHSGVSK